MLSGSDGRVDEVKVTCIENRVRSDTMTQLFIRYIICLLTSLVFVSISWGSNYPLEPPDTSSPQATLQNFLHHSLKAANTLRDNDFKFWVNKEDLNRAIYFLDLSNVAPVQTEDVGIESVLLLREILDRIQLPEFATIPDETAVKNNNLEKWVIPHTEITIVKVTEGSRAGTFLFSANTVDRLDEYYEKIQHLPYKDGAVQTIYQDYMQSTGWLYPDALISKLPQWMMHIYKGQALWKWIELIMTLLIGGVIILLIIKGYRHWNKKSSNKAWRFHMLIFPLMAMGLCLIIRRLVDRQMHVTGEVFTVVTMLLEVGFLLFLSWGVMILGDACIHGIIASKKIKEEALNADFIKLVGRIISFGLVFFLFYRAGSYLGVPVTAVFASAGIAGIAVALAAKETLSNFFGGVSILMDRPFRAGDYIVLDTGERGMVKAVGMRSTRLLTRDDILITIPNSVITNVKIVNQSAPYPHFRVRIKIGVAYGSDLDQVERILVGVAQGHPLVMEDPAPRARLRMFNQSSIDFELLVWAKEPQDRGRITHEISKKIYRSFNDEGVNIPFPQRSIHIVDKEILHNNGDTDERIT